MDSQMQTKFLNHIFNFFALQAKDEGPDDTAKQEAAGCPDVPVLLGVLRAAGFIVKYSDKSDFGGTSNGCRAIIVCKRSGTRVVMDGEGPCTCPSEGGLQRYLDDSSASRAPSRAPSPTPSTVGMLEDPLNTSTMSAMTDKSPAADGHLEGPPKLTRQRTWNRDVKAADDADNNGSRLGLGTPESRRVSAPPAPVQGAWTTLNGDDLNVFAATDLLQEAISLLTGIKKVSLRNTPVGPSRRLSAAARRMSSDTFLQPLRPLSRTSSASSGLASSKSSSSLQSNNADTPRPLGGVGGGGVSGVSNDQSVRTLRRTISSAAPGPSGRVATVVRTKSDAGKKGESTTNTRVSKVPSLKAPSTGISKATLRTPMRIGIKTNGSVTSAKGTLLFKKSPTCPEPQV